MTESAGYVKLYRKLLENPIWTHLAPAVAKVAIHFLLHANYKPIQWYDGAAAVEIPAGSFITSLASTAAACNISVQQVRDAFDHLVRTQFATYRRTHRWTLVTLLNWATYQASPEDAEHTEEHRVEHHENRQRTLNKKERSKEYTPPTPSQEGEAAGVYPSDPDELPFATPLDPLLEEQNKHSHFASTTRNGSGRAPAIAAAIKQVAERIHARHPTAFGRRDCSASRVEKQLAAILKHQRVPGHKQADYLERIDRTHAAMCASETWSRDGGQYAKGLENWLAPTKERYLIEVPTNSAPAANAVGYGDMESWKKETSA